MAWADTANNLRQLIGQKTTNLANIGQSERESRRARNMALLNTLAEAGLGVGRMAFEAGEAEKGREFEREMLPREYSYDTAKIKYEYEFKRAELEKDHQLAMQRGDHERANDLERKKAELDYEYNLRKELADVEGGWNVKYADAQQAGRGGETQEIGALGPYVDNVLRRFAANPSGQHLLDPNTGRYLIDQFNDEGLAAFLRFAQDYNPGIDAEMWNEALKRGWVAPKETTTVSSPKDTETGRARPLSSLVNPPENLAFSRQGVQAKRRAQIPTLEEQKKESVMEQIMSLARSAQMLTAKPPGLNTELNKFLGLQSNENRWKRNLDRMDDAELTVILMNLQNLLGEYTKQGYSPLNRPD